MPVGVLPKPEQISAPEDLDLNPVEVARTSDFDSSNFGITRIYHSGEVSYGMVVSSLTPEQDKLLQSAETVIVTVMPRATKAKG